MLSQLGNQQCVIIREGGLVPFFLCSPTGTTNEAALSGQGKQLRQFVEGSLGESVNNKDVRLEELDCFSNPLLSKDEVGGLFDPAFTDHFKGRQLKASETLHEEYLPCLTRRKKHLVDVCFVIACEPA